MPPVSRAPLAFGLFLCGLSAGVFLLFRAPHRAGEVASSEDPALVAARATWRAEQDKMMRSELSPLSRIDYVHLPAGEHLIKPATPPLNLSAEALAPYSGELRIFVAEGQLRYTAAPPIPVNGVPTAQAELKGGEVLSLGRLRLLVSGMPKDPSLAVYDPEAPARRAYKGLRYYPDNPDYVVNARLKRYAAPRAVRVAASRGEDREQLALGTLSFTLPGHSQPATMEAYAEKPDGDRLFLIFKDTTSGSSGQSYGAGRYLYAKLAADDTVKLDFNQAWNPLCAYSVYFHCPIPPRKNWFDFPIPVGEKRYYDDH